MEREELDPKLQALLDEDPVAFFHALADMRAMGQDPKEMGLIPKNPVTKKVKSASRQADQLVSHATAAADDWLDGVKNPSRDPIAAALAANEKRIDRLQQSIKDKKWEKNLAKSSHAEIVEVAEEIGASGYSAGVEARKKKILRVFNELQPLQQSVSDTIQAMPDKTDADREKRLLAARKLMLELGRKRAGA